MFSWDNATMNNNIMSLWKNGNYVPCFWKRAETIEMHHKPKNEAKLRALYVGLLDFLLSRATVLQRKNKEWIKKKIHKNNLNISFYSKEQFLELRLLNEIKSIAEFSSTSSFSSLWPQTHVNCQYYFLKMTQLWWICLQNKQWCLA